ncbi:glycoside hydrolase family 28 protein [Sphingomonas sp. S2-65]|uniref:glycoside hydrolase family 28 protein n=1 Tax=Sphingomonas sp. S2-65 TaxID=2903960 RepID=UPI001F3D8B8A|nr:glycosyl hydrolase family 28 protein [Sphingomonas sp. S2-65]UYY58152.1 glycosyl hydrolase family 28 protein [Sphingomonas sp. S2-65]
MSTDRRSFLTAAGLGAMAATSARAAPLQRNAKPAIPALPVLPPPLANGVRVDPREFGAKADGTTKDTAAVQQALDRCAVMGGGEVVLARGTFLVGAIRIGSNTTLRVDADATLQGSGDLADYPVVQVRWEGRWVPGYTALVWAQDARNIRLSGKGRIVASSAIPGRVAKSGLRHPALFEFVDVRGLSVTDLHTEQNDMWSIHPVYCDDVLFRGVTVNGKADGIDVDSCRRVAIDKCNFDTVDDCISLKSGRGLEGTTIGRPTEDVTITDCTFRDHRWACIGIGSETSGGVRRVLVERCQFLKAHTFSVYLKSRPGRGAFIEDITMRDLDVSGAGYGFLRLNFLDSGKQDQFPVPGFEGIPRVGNFVFERIRVKDVPILVEAVNIHPEKPLQGFVLRDITGTCGHGITLANMRDVTLEGINVNVFSGPKLAAVNVTGRGLEGAAKLVPTERPPAVVPSATPFVLGMRPGAPN